MLKPLFGKRFRALQFYTFKQRWLMKFKKIDKEFTLTDSTVNCYGFRLLTAGYQLGDYSKNPIGYYMHGRDAGVLLKWDDIKMEGDKVTGKPVINLSHPRGQQTVDEIENGFLNAASMGHFVVLEMSEDPSLKLAGQTGPTVTKWFNRECSLVDVPGNFNALKLFDADENEINLADFNKKFTQSMKQIILTAAQLAVLNLKADAEPSVVDTTINDLVAKASKVDQLEQQLTAANLAKKTAEDALAALQKTTVEKEVTDMLSAALNVDKKITKAVHDQLAADYKNNPTALKTLLTALPAFTSIATAIGNSKEDAKGLAAMSFDDLDKQGKLEELKAKDPDTFKAKWKEKFGTDYNG